jgi:hypothetical protein
MAEAVVSYMLQDRIWFPIETGIFSCTTKLIPDQPGLLFSGHCHALLGSKSAERQICPVPKLRTSETAILFFHRRICHKHWNMVWRNFDNENFVTCALDFNNHFREIKYKRFVFV